MAQGIFIRNKFYWNLDANVGPGCPNKTEDVQLVQLGYRCMANNPKAGLTPEEKVTYGKVTPGAPYNGGFNDPLSAAIRLHQKMRGGTQDGVVSTIKNGTGVYAPHTAWMLAAIDNNIADVLGASWPHLDKHSQCPAALRDASINVLTPVAA